MSFEQIRGRLFVLVALGALSFSTAAVGQKFVIGPNASCGQWTKLRTQPGLAAGRLQHETWVTGYLSGANTFYQSEPDFLVGQGDAAGFYAWLDNYCRSNPLEPLQGAVNSLIVELTKRAEKRPPK